MKIPQLEYDRPQPQEDDEETTTEQEEPKEEEEQGIEWFPFITIDPTQILGPLKKSKDTI